ncbi:MAG: hypothetical protein IAE82_13395 [Opitutaceae bacterium]|nr:hypothetical protein [Opitutaceae bacterium]
MPRKHVVLRSSFAALALVALLGASWLLRAAPGDGASGGQTATGAPGVADASPTLHPVHVRPGPATPKVMATLPQTGGVPAMVSCSTCHATRRPDVTNASAEALNEFHQGLQYRHGGLSCLSCHNAANYDTLRRADGTALEYPNTVQLCAQCHGPQYRDYLNGSHGGMTGHWDLRVGGRVRNTCTDCHDVHAPAYPQVRPVFPPRDRGARQQLERSAAETHETSSHAAQH